MPRSTDDEQLALSVRFSDAANASGMASKMPDQGLRLEPIRTHDPIATDLNGHAGARTPKKGAKIAVHLATLPDAAPAGEL